VVSKDGAMQEFSEHKSLHSALTEDAKAAPVFSKEKNSTYLGIDDKIFMNPENKDEKLSAREVAIKKAPSLKGSLYLDYAAESVLSKAIQVKTKSGDNTRLSFSGKNWGNQDSNESKKVNVKQEKYGKKEEIPNSNCKPIESFQLIPNLELHKRNDR
jgi:hypothetical protein